MNRMRKLCYILFFLLTVKTAETQGVYVKDIQYQGIPCVLLANEKTGIVVPKSTDAKTPRNQLTLAPIQAIRLPDGTLTGAEPVFLEPASDVRECSAYPFFTDGYGGKEMPVKSRTLTVTKPSPGEIVLAVRYDIAKPDNKGTRDKKGDKGYYTCTISLKTGEPVIVIEDETDWNFSYKFETGRNLFNQARYRGRYSSSVEEGYMLVKGKKEVYKNENEFPGREALVDLPYDAPLASCKPFRHYTALSQWNVWPTGTGWYWQWYNNQGSAQSPVVGIFHGRASRLMGASCVQVNFFTRSDNRAAGIRININRTNPSRYYSKKVRVQWGIHTGTKGADITEPNETSSILKWFNRKSGLADRLFAYEKKLLTPAPELEWGAFYQDKNTVQQMVQKARKDAGFVRLLSEQDDAHKLLFEAWAGNTCSSSKLYHVLKTHYETFKEMCTSGQGFYAYARTKKFSGECRDTEITTDDASYVRASDWFRRDVLLAGGLMAGASNGALTLTKQQKDSLKMFSAVYAQVLWDNDFVPLAYAAKETEDEQNVDHGVNYGQINMLVAYEAGRDFFALLYRNDPQFKNHYNAIVARCKKVIDGVINEYGASTASPHYTQPTLESLVLLLLQLKQQGNNFFVTEPRLAAFARFYLNLLTPPSVRFAGNRKLVSFGDGSEESAALFGLLATGFRSGNAAGSALAADLDVAFCNGPMRSLPKAGVMALVYDYTKKTDSYTINTLGSASVPGYLSHFRTYANTPQETALWLLNGNHYSDHRGDDDGELSVYALRAPLSLSRSSFYEPYANAATVRSMVIPLNSFPGWSGSGQYISYGNQFKRTWKQSSLNRYTAFSRSAATSVVMGTGTDTWKRNVVLLHEEELWPVIVVHDETGGRGPHIWSMPFFSEGAIQLPDGNRVNTAPPGNCVTQNLLPDAVNINGKTEWPLQNGWNRFSFTGQEWRNYFPEKNINGTDWFLYTYNQGREVKASFTEWTNFYVPGPEITEFKNTHPYKFPKNCVEKNPAIHYRETQQIIRFLGSGRFMNIIMPFRKGQPPANCAVTQNNEQQFTITRTVNNTIQTIEVSADAVVMNSARKTTVTTFGNSTAGSSVAQLSVSGGIAELVLEEGKKITLTVPVNSGNRNIQLPPGVWTAGTPPPGISTAISGNKLTVITGKDDGRVSNTTANMATVIMVKR